MRRISLVVLSILLSTSVAEAKPKHFYKSKEFWASFATIVAAVIADAHTTNSVIRRGYVEKNNLFLPLRPKPRTVWLVNAGAIAGYFGWQVFMWKQTEPQPQWVTDYNGCPRNRTQPDCVVQMHLETPRLKWQDHALRWGMPAIAGYGHGMYGALHNARLK